jgi:t-SNARE complex subunit (syntaxin)
MFSKASTKAKENRREKSFPILPFIIIIVIILVLVSKTKAVAAEIQETVVVVDQVYWIS